MPRFLIIAGILLAAAIIFDPSANVEVVESEVAPATSNEEQGVAVSNVAALRKFAPEFRPAAYAIGRAATSAVDRADVEADEALDSPSQTLSSSQDIKDKEDTSALALLSPYERKTVAQTELKRLSCYTGKIDGIWGSKSREAISLFNERSDSSFHLNESVELLTALKNAPDGLCDRSCSGGTGNSCEIMASAEGGEIPAQDEMETAEENAPSYLPPWMRGQEVAEATTENTEVSESYTATHTSVSRRVYERPRPAPRPVYRTRRKKKSWLPDNWPGVR